MIASSYEPWIRVLCIFYFEKVVKIKKMIVTNEPVKK